MPVPLPLSLRIAHILAVLALMLTQACTTPPAPDARKASARALSAGKLTARTLPVTPLPLTAFVPPVGAYQTLHVYIEGDGFAWQNRNRPSRDPTPLNPVGLHMAMADTRPGVVYLARPCQYAATPCHDRKWWTTHRFAPGVVASTSAAIDMLKSSYGAQTITLTGFSGGGTMAALLAARRPDVLRLTTMAATLDTRAWQDHHRLSPLTGSLNPADDVTALQSIPQTHYAGSNDTVVSPRITHAFAARFPASRPPDIRIIEGYTHDCCWPQLVRIGMPH